MRTKGGVTRSTFWSVRGSGSFAKVAACGIILVVPDYVNDLEAVANRTLVRMSEYGVVCRVGRA